MIRHNNIFYRSSYQVRVRDIMKLVAKEFRSRSNIINMSTITEYIK